MRGGSPRLLIVRLSAIGDVVRVLPALSALRAKFPEAQIDWVVEAAGGDLLQGHPEIDRLHIFHRGDSIASSFRSFVGVARQLRSADYDIALDFHGILKSAVLMRACGAPRRVGFSSPRAREGSVWYANERVALPEMVMNRVDENLALVEMVSNVGIDKQLNIGLPIRSTPDLEAWARRHADAARRLVIIHAPVERREKQWPLERFAALCDRMASDGRFQPVLTYGPGQIQFVEALSAQCQSLPLVAPALPSLQHFAWLAAQAALYVGGDTGPMHIAAAVGTPVVAIFGGTDPRMHRPFGSESIVLGGVTLTHSRERVSIARALAVLDSVLVETVFEACVRLGISGGAA